MQCTAPPMLARICYHCTVALPFCELQSKSDNDSTRASVRDSRPDTAPQEQLPSLSEKNFPLSHMLIRLASKQRGPPSVRPLPHRALVGQSRRALPPIASHAARPRFPCRSPAFQSPAPLAPSSSVRRPSTSGAPCAELAMASRAHVSWRLMSSLAEPRVPTQRCSPSVPTPTTGIDRLRPSPLLYCKCMFQVF
jgi:hypothetical protein